MQIESKNFSIIGTRIPQSIRDFPFNKAAQKILGKKKFVSFVLVSSKKIQEFNSQYRKRDHSTDILSFPNPDGGEILISLADARKKSSEFQVSSTQYLHYLIIHGLLHLKGYDHGSKMERLEKKFCNFFGLKFPFDKLNEQDGQNHSRHRYRHLPSKSGSHPSRSRP